VDFFFRFPETAEKWDFVCWVGHCPGAEFYHSPTMPVFLFEIVVAIARRTECNSSDLQFDWVGYTHVISSPPVAALCA
jgi:hypothetical protein